MTPTRDELQRAITAEWGHQECSIILGDRFEVRPLCGYRSHGGGNCVFVYDFDVICPVTGSVLERRSEWLWFDNARVGTVEGNVAQLYLLAIQEAWRGRRIGSAYIYANINVLSDYGIQLIYLNASHDGPRFWSFHGFQFVNAAHFWKEYAEYCEHNEVEYIEDIDKIASDYFLFLRESNLSYPMYRVL